MKDFQKPLAPHIVCSLDYVRGHCSYIDDMRINGTQVWERVVHISVDVGRACIADALDSDVKSWMLPPNKECVIYDADYSYIYGIYVHDDQTYIVRAKRQNITKYVNTSACSPTLRTVLQALGESVKI